MDLVNCDVIISFQRLRQISLIICLSYKNKTVNNCAQPLFPFLPFSLRPLWWTHMGCWSSPLLCLVQEAEQEEVKVTADTQPPRSAKKGKASASSTPQTGSDKKERKGKHKGQPANIKTNG